MTNIKTHPLSSENSLLHLYKIDQNTAIHTFSDLNKMANLIQSDLPFSKVAVLFKGKAREKDLLLYNVLKEKGLKPVGYYFKENCTADVEHFSGMFYLPEDVRAVLTCELSLSCAVNYFATVRKISAYFLLSENIGFQPLNNLTFIRNGHKVNRFQFSCKKTIAIINSGEDFAEKTFLSTTLSALLYLLDYNLGPSSKNVTTFPKEYNAIKKGLIDLADKVYKETQIESIFNIVALLNEFTKDNQRSLVLFSFLDSVGVLNNMSAFDKVLILEQIFKVFLDNENNVLSNYSYVASQLGFFFSVDVGVLLQGIKRQITGLNSAFEMERIKEEIFCLYKLFLLFKRNYEKQFVMLKGENSTNLHSILDFLYSLKE